MLTVPRARAGATRRSQAASPWAGTRRPRASLTRTRSAVTARERFVRFDNLLDELVPHDVAVVEVHERDAFDVADDLHRFHEPRRAALRQIDLRDVARDDGFGAEADAREKHLHLLGRRV